jgi:uncharacterized metal-binding protein YceD (DUF177 family)
VAPASEFSRSIRVDPWPDAGIEVDLRAEPAERAALARRFDLVALDALRGWGRLERTESGELWFRGWLEAEVVQSCVVSLEDVAVTVRVPVEQGYRRASAALATGAPGEAGSWDDELEVLPGAELDLGELLAQELSLALDPYPRAPDADILVSEVLGPNISFGSAESDRPFAALGQLPDKRAR